jgi:multidrug efflux pump subunit AcrA (membrane-fusion protein)
MATKYKKIKMRFYQGGTVVWVGVKKGDIVKKGQGLAKLDDKLDKIDLDIDLANYRRARAEFEDVARKLPSPQNEEEKGVKEIAQAKLDVAVKKVEKQKYMMDKLTLVSPVNGEIVDDSDLVAGMNITPSGFPMTIKIIEEKLDKKAES